MFWGQNDHHSVAQWLAGGEGHVAIFYVGHGEFMFDELGEYAPDRQSGRLAGEITVFDPAKLACYQLTTAAPELAAKEWGTSENLDPEHIQRWQELLTALRDAAAKSGDKTVKAAAIALAKFEEGRDN